jgi:hypothetical protein
MLAIQAHNGAERHEPDSRKIYLPVLQLQVTTARPDGGILLTLRSSEGKVFKRALTYQQMHNADQLSWAISAIRRDLAEQASELRKLHAAKPAAFCPADVSLAVNVNALNKKGRGASAPALVVRNSYVGAAEGCDL